MGGPRFASPAAPPPPRSNGDITATVLLGALQLTATGVSVVLTLRRLLWLMMPICSDNCDSPAVNHFVQKSIHGAVVSVVGIAVGFLLAGIGTLVSGMRRTRMWKWPALGVVIVVISLLVAIGLWTEALSPGQ